MQKIGLVTDLKHSLEDDESLLHDAFKQDDGFDVKIVAWDDPNIDWASFDILVIRTTWNYVDHVNEFVEWAKTVESKGVKLVNPAKTIAWNSNKRYLLELATAGIPILPTVYIDVSNLKNLQIPSSDTGWIVKPAIGAGAVKIQKFDKNSSAQLMTYVKKLVLSDTDVLLQPFAKEITRGEVSFVFFGGEFSHACVKVPASGDFRVQHEYGGSDKYYAATQDQINQAKAVISAAPYNIFYCRVDMIEVDCKLLLMELEAIEPYLFFGYNNAPKLFVSKIKKYI